MLRFRRMRSLQKFAAVHSQVYKHFNQEISLADRVKRKETRTDAFEEWCGLGAEQGAELLP